MKFGTVKVYNIYIYEKECSKLKKTKNETNLTHQTLSADDRYFLFRRICIIVQSIL